jgi:hypothetical protein
MNKHKNTATNYDICSKLENIFEYFVYFVFFTVLTFQDMKTKLLNLQTFTKLLLHNTFVFSYLILNLKLKLTTTKPRVSTVTKRFDDYYDESEEDCIDDLLSKLDLAEECTAKEATNLANTKKALLGLDSGLYDHMEVAEYRVEAEKAAAKEASVKPEGNLSSKLHSHFVSMASPFTPQDSMAPATVSMNVTPTTGMEGHANDMHHDLFHPIDEAMTFGDKPTTSERPDPLSNRCSTGLIPPSNNCWYNLL